MVKRLRGFFDTWVFAKGVGLKRGAVYSALFLLTALTALASFYCGGEESRLSRNNVPGEAPGEITALKVMNGNGSVQLEWQKPSGIVLSYKIFQNKISENGEKSEPVQIESVSQDEKATQSVDEMDNGQKYSFQVQAINDVGAGPISDEIFAMPRPENLGSLNGLAANASSGEVVLTWEAKNLATKYIVHRKISSDTFFNEIETVTKEECSAQECMYVDTGLTNNTSYNYKVIAVMVIDGDGLEPAEVKSLNALTSARPRPLSDGQVRITYTIVNAMRSLTDGALINLKTREPISPSVVITGYKIETLTETGDPIPNVPVITKATLATSLTISVDQPYGLARQYRVTAQSGQGQSLAPISGSQNTIDVPAILPDAPSVSDFTAAVTTDKKISLSWSNTGTATHYTIQKTIIGDSASELVAKQATGSFSVENGRYTYIDTAVDAGMSYSYELTPIIDLGISGVTDVFGTVVSSGNVEISGPLSLNDPAYYADPFAFTGSSFKTRRGVGKGTFDVRSNPGAAWPQGMLQMAPVNIRTSGYWSAVSDTGGGVFWLYQGTTRDRIKGFATSFITGPGCQIGYDFPFIFEPRRQTSYISSRAGGNFAGLRNYSIGNSNAYPNTPDTRRARREVKTQEYAEPGYYRLQYNVSGSSWVRAEFTVTPRTGVGKITFPSNASDATALLSTFDALRRETSFLEIKSFGGGTNAVSLRLKSDFFCQQGGSSSVYAVFVFDVPFTRSIRSNKQEANLFFTLPSTKIISMKIGKSSISAEQAYKNILSEQNRPGMYSSDVSGVSYLDLDWNFTKFRSIAYEKWNEFLGRVSVLDEIGTTDDARRHHRLEEKRIFYSALYQTSLHPNIFSDYNGDYLGFGGNTHNVSETPPQEIQYQNYSGWDTYRGQHQLISFLDKDLARDTAQSLINNAKQSRSGRQRFTKWGYRNAETGVMEGDPGTILVASSLAYGGKGFDYRAAFDIMKAGYGSVMYASNETNAALKKSDGNFRSYDYNVTTKKTSWTGRTLLPKATATDRAGHMSNHHEFAAGDFAKAQFLRNVKQTGSTVITDADMLLYYRDFMNHAGDAWKKAYLWYKAKNTTSSDDYIIVDLNGLSQPHRKVAGFVYGGVNGLGVDYITGVNATSARPRVSATWNKWHSYLNNFNPSGYSYTVNGESQTVPPYCPSGNSANRGCGGEVGGWREGEPTHYHYMLPFDTRGLFNRLGPVNGADADDKFETYTDEDGEELVRSPYHFARLRHFLHYGNTYNTGEHGDPHLNMGNQPSYSVPWALNYTGYAHFLQMSIRRIQNFVTDDTINRALSGNDDLGSLTSQYVWSSMGLYPAHPGLGILHVTSPRFKKMVIRDNLGRVLVVSDAKSVGDSNKTCSNTKSYNTHCFLIDSMKKNGQNYTKTYIRYYKDIEDSIESGGLRLEFNLYKLTQGNRQLGSISNDGNFVPKALTGGQKNAYYNDYEAFRSSTKFGQRLSDLPPSGSGGIRRAQDDNFYYGLIDRFAGNKKNPALTEGVSESDYNEHGDFGVVKGDGSFSLEHNYY